MNYNMYKNEIGRLDNQDLKLRYYLGGLKLEEKQDGKEYICNYWSCDINCSCFPVPDDENLVEVKNFIIYHGLTNEDFLRLSYVYLTGGIMKYKGTYSPLFVELDKVLLPYNYNIKKWREIPDNDFREKELESIVYAPIVKEFCAKYHLTILDFIVLAKTSLNYRFTNLRGVVNFDNKFGRELSDIIDSYNLYLPLEDIEKYREEYHNKLEIAELVSDVKSAQKRYLLLMKKLLIKDPNLAIEIYGELSDELGLDTKRRKRIF